MSPEIIADVVRTYFEALRTGNEQAWVNTFAEDAVSHDPVGAKPIRGHQSLQEFFQSIVNAFKKVSLTEDQIFIAGDGAAVKWTGRGISKQGRKVHFEGIDVFEINEEGRIQTLYAYWNPAEMMAQL